MAIYAVHQSEPKFLFLINYKVMYSSLYDILPTYFPETKFQYKNQIKNQNFSDFTKIAIVRHPYSRTISTYFDKCINAPKDFILKENTYLQHCQGQLLQALNMIRNSSYEIVTTAIQYNMNENPTKRTLLNENFKRLQSITFEEYLKCLAILLNYKNVDRHFQEQYKVFKIPKQNPFYNHNKILKNTKIFKLENINNGWSTICNLLRKEMKLRVSNKTDYEKTNFEKFYTDNFKEIMSNIYKKDFSTFNYAMDL